MFTKLNNKLTPVAVPVPMCALQHGLQLTKHLYEVFDRKYFVGLTGGLVYRDGPRKDIDIIIYRHRGQLRFEMMGLKDLLIKAGFEDLRFYGYVTKCTWQGFDVDLLHPESIYGHEGDDS